jgi:hypothetical protein
MVAPLGLLMGFGFPTGMALVNALDTRPTPWFWAINGAAGVLAASIAVGVNIAFSISTSIWLSAICYLLVGAVALALAPSQDDGDGELVRFFASSRSEKPRLQH